MDFINKIGQRKCANLLFFATVLFAIVGFILKYFQEQKLGITNDIPYVQKAFLGVFLFSMANGFLLWSAHINKEYRLISIFLMSFILIMNISLLLLKLADYLFFITLIEILVSIVYLIFIKISETDRVNKERRNRLKTKDTSTVA